MNELFRLALDLPPQASSVARHIDYLHYTVIGAAFLVAFLAFLVTVSFLVRFRERPGYTPRARSVPHSLEVVLASFTLVVFIVWWVIGFSQYRDIHRPPPGAIRIYVIAKQWMWQFVYPNGTNSEADLRVPVGQPVEVMITSRDVIHSFYVPAFRLKQDAVPGRITSLWFTAVTPGTYDILCAEYCGAGHSRMRGHVIAMAPAEYAKWAGGHGSAELATVGEQLAVKYGCLRCHTVDGTPHIGPTWRGLYNSLVPLSDGTLIVADDAYLTESMMDPTAKIVRAYPPIMPSYLGQLSGPEAASIVEFIRSLRGSP
ncbi:MAG TPA: cytochrome c oxidase subunit II [Kofleriaceae bacterium]|nr:cytochrome c oxidase subunit II [Kofleriaceae bacterium]